jgi:hypothetical protein
MDTKLLTALAKTAVATTFGGPIAGGEAVLTEAVDLLSKWVGAAREPACQSAMHEIERGLVELTRSEGIDEDQLTQAIETARWIIARQGLSATEIVDRDLDADAVSRAVLSASAAILSDLDEPARTLCERAIRSVYRQVLAKPEAIPDLERAFKRAVLSRLTELGDLPHATLQAMKGPLDAAALLDLGMRWRPELYPPSAMLRPEFGIVPFHGRKEVLGELREWCGWSGTVGVSVHTGAGGMGKTRLMMELSQQLSREGWRAGFLAKGISGRGLELALDAIFDTDRPLLIVVDYAETRPEELVAVLKRSVESTNTVRIVLLARELGEWWRRLTREGAGVGDLVNGPATNVHRLVPLAANPADRGVVSYFPQVGESKSPRFQRGVL